MNIRTFSKPSTIQCSISKGSEVRSFITDIAKTDKNLTKKELINKVKSKFGDFMPGDWEYYYWLINHKDDFNKQCSKDTYLFRIHYSEGRDNNKWFNTRAHNIKEASDKFKERHPKAKMIGTPEKIEDHSEDLMNYEKSLSKQFSKALVNPVTTPDSIAQKPKLNTDIYFNTARLEESLNSMKKLFSN